MFFKGFSESIPFCETSTVNIGLSPICPKCEPLVTFNGSSMSWLKAKERLTLKIEEFQNSRAGLHTHMSLEACSSHVALWLPSTYLGGLKSPLIGCVLLYRTCCHLKNPFAISGLVSVFL